MRSCEVSIIWPGSLAPPKTGIASICKTIAINSKRPTEVKVVNHPRWWWRYLREGLGVFFWWVYERFQRWNEKKNPGRSQTGRKKLSQNLCDEFLIDLICARGVFLLVDFPSSLHWNLPNPVTVTQERFAKNSLLKWLSKGQHGSWVHSIPQKFTK